MRPIAANANHCQKPLKTIGDIVSRRHSPSFFESDYIQIILPLLQESDIGAAAVIDDNGRLCGLLTERAILRHVFARTCGKSIHAANVRKYIEDMRVDEVMIQQPETLDDDMSIEDAAQLMLRRGYRFMPVVSRYDRHRLVGIVSERELAQHLHQKLQEAKQSEKTSKSILSYMLAEPYGGGFQLESTG
jgi:CBS domain-containing protein